MDTSAFIAFRDRSDSYHPLFVQLFSDPPMLITSSLVVAEGHGWFLKRYDVLRALEFIDFVTKLKPLKVISVGSKELGRSYSYLRKFSDQKLTLTDACGLFLMQRYKVSECWSTDRHLALTGRSLIIQELG